MSKLRKFIINLLGDLVRIESINPPGLNYDVIADLLRDFLKNLGLTVKLIEIPEDYLDKYYPYRPQHRGFKRVIVYARAGKGKPILQFNGHYDVVPPGPGWSMDPFKLVVRGGKAYGRGVSDMKGGIVAVLATLQSLIEEGKLDSLEGSLEVVFVPDEESAGIGTKYFVEKVMESKPKYVIIPEPTSLRNIVIGHKGLARGIIRVYGKQAHASTPWLGDNAFLKAAKLALRINREFKRRFSQEKSNYLMEYGKASYNTLTLGGYAISPTGKESIVPGAFEFSFDMRSIPECDIRGLVRKLSKLIYEYNVRAEVTLLTLVDSVVLERSKLTQIIKECTSKILGFEPREVVSSGRLDITYYIPLGVEAVAYGPGDPKQPHKANEYIKLRDIEYAVQAYKYLIEHVTFKNSKIKKDMASV